jgi:hypothetical protein
LSLVFIFPPWLFFPPGSFSFRYYLKQQRRHLQEQSLYFYFE